MKNKNLNKALTLLISVVWLANGLFCKVLNLVPRHEQIVARILGEDYSRPLTILIGLSEVLMAASLPINLMITIPIGISAAHDTYKMNYPKNVSWNQMSKFARFPQGIPDHIDLDQIE